MKWLTHHKHGLLGFAVSAAYWPGILSAAFVPRWAVVAVGVPLVSDLDTSNLDPAVRHTLIGLLAVSCLSLLASPDPAAGFRDVLFLLFLCGAFIMGSRLERMDDVMMGLGFGLGLSSLLCIPQWFGAPILPQGSPPAGLFYSSLVLGEFSALILIWALLRPARAVAVLALVPVLLTGSRVALVTVAVALIYSWRPGWKILAVASAVFVVPVMICLFGIGEIKFNSAGLRAVIWGATAMSLTPFGNGLGWFQAAHPAEQYAHSDVLQAMAELGIGSVFLLALPILVLIRPGGTNAERATFVGVCVQCAISFPLHLPASGFLAAVLAGYLACSGNRLHAREPLRRAGDESDFQWSPAAARAIADARGYGCEIISIRPSPARD